MGLTVPSKSLGSWRISFKYGCLTRCPQRAAQSPPASSVFPGSHLEVAVQVTLLLQRQQVSDVAQHLLSPLSVPGAMLARAGTNDARRQRDDDEELPKLQDAQ